MSPFIKNGIKILGAKSSPLHLLAEHIWYLPLTNPNPWSTPGSWPLAPGSFSKRSESDILSGMRKNHRNLIRRAEREGVTVEASKNPEEDLQHFFTLYDETRKRHGFVPYPEKFIRAQVARFHPRGECTLYLAKYEGKVIASSVHMHLGGETSYHHGASSSEYSKVPASYALQWRAIQDALKRGDRVFNFWGVSPGGVKRHPFAGVRTFKTGFGGQLLELQHCLDIPVNSSYYLTRAFETLRKWKRGF
jgi:vancomycin resistance protein VanK